MSDQPKSILDDLRKEISSATPNPMKDKIYIPVLVGEKIVAYINDEYRKITTLIASTCEELAKNEQGVSDCASSQLDNYPANTSCAHCDDIDWRSSALKCKLEILEHAKSLIMFSLVTKKPRENAFIYIRKNGAIVESPYDCDTPSSATELIIDIQKYMIAVNESGINSDAAKKLFEDGKNKNSCFPALATLFIEETSKNKAQGDERSEVGEPSETLVDPYDHPITPQIKMEHSPENGC